MVLIEYICIHTITVQTLKMSIRMWELGMHAIEENQEWYSKNSSIHLFKYICILRANSLDVMDFYMI